MRKKFEDLSKRVWCTEKARFTAAERCRKKHQALVFAISFLSVSQVLIAISSICGFYIPLIGGNKAEYMTLVASIFILVIANQDSLSILLNHSDSYHRCANKLHKLQQEIDIELAGESVNKDTISGFANKYSDILEFHDLNHWSSDYLKVKSEFPDTFEVKCYISLFFKVRHFISIYWLPTLYCIAPFLVVIISKILLP